MSVIKNKKIFIPLLFLLSIGLFFVVSRDSYIEAFEISGDWDFSLPGITCVTQDIEGILDVNLGDLPGNGGPTGNSASISVSLSADPSSSGSIPLNDVDLTAVVDSTTNLNWDANFWCDCNSDCLDLEFGNVCAVDCGPPQRTTIGFGNQTVTEANACDYLSRGVYYPKVAVSSRKCLQEVFGSCVDWQVWAAEDRAAVNTELSERPTNLSATAVSCSQINLSWTDNSNNEDGFVVLRSADTVSWDQQATLGENVTTYSHTGLSENTRYYYLVASYNSYGQSDTSNSATVVTSACLVPAVDIKANGLDGPITIAYNTATTLSWNSTDAASCTASGNWSGNKALAGSESTGDLTGSKTYVIDCDTATDSVTVNVGAAPPAADIKANGSDGPITIDYNTAATLTWTSQYATTCTASNGWSGNKVLSGSESTGNLTEQTTYVIDCDTATDSVTVNVSAAPPTDDPPESSALEVTQGDYCAIPAHYFSWDYYDPDGDNQIRYQFQVDNNSNFSSPEVDRDYTGLSNPSPTTNNQTVLVVESAASERIVYNTTYYWRVKVYSQSLDSGWVSGPSFSTETHRYPVINFSWEPLNPSEGGDVWFTDESTVYGGAIKSAWNWIFVNGDPPTSDEQNPTVKFISQGDNAVTLSVTDSDNYTCPSPTTVSVQEALPWWKEILPW